MKGIENKTLETDDGAERLPIAVLLQNKRSRTIYRVDNTRAFLDEATHPTGIPEIFDPIPSVDRVETMCRKYGTVVDPKAFKKVRVSGSRTEVYASRNHFYELVRADFEGTVKTT